MRPVGLSDEDIALVVVVVVWMRCLEVWQSRFKGDLNMKKESATRRIRKRRRMWLIEEG